MSQSSKLQEDIDVKLDTILVNKGLPIIEKNFEADEYLNLTFNELQNISGTNAEDISFVLEQRALFVQKYSNRLNAKLLQVENNLYKALSKVYDEYKTYGGFDIVLGKACMEHDYINDLNEMKIDIKIQLTDLAFLSKHITKMADKVANMKWRNR